jgi:hypothetical protein
MKLNLYFKRQTGDPGRSFILWFHQRLLIFKHFVVPYLDLIFNASASGLHDVPSHFRH